VDEMTQSSTGRSWAGILLPEAVRRERLNNSLNQLADIDKSWNNRLTMEGLSCIEDYVKGRYNFILDIESLAIGKPKYYRAILYVANATVGIERSGWSDHVRKFCDDVCEDQNSMFVEDVKIRANSEGRDSLPCMA